MDKVKTFVTLFAQVGILGIFTWVIKQILESSKAKVQAIESQKEAELAQKDAVISRLEVQIESKSQDVERLNNNIRDLERDIQELKEKDISSKQHIEKLEERASRILSGLQSEDLDELGLIESFRLSVGKITEPGDEIQKSIVACNQAAKWIQLNLQDFAKAATEEANGEFPQLLSSDETRRKFNQDINKCLDWLRDSLKEGDFLPTDALLDTLSLDFPFPYRTALSFIKNNRKAAALSYSADGYLKLFIDHLVTALGETA